MYEVTEDIGHPYWELIFEYVLRQCGYLEEFHTEYVMVDNRDFVKTTHERCGPFSLVVLSQRRGRVTTSSGPTLSETLSSKTLQVS